MIISMTGFGSKNLKIPLNKTSNLFLSIEIKTLNSRFFEMSCRIPFFLNSFETEISNILKSKLCRGKIFITIQDTECSEPIETIEASTKVAKNYVKALEKIKAECKLEGKITINDIIGLPNIFISNKPKLSLTSKKTLLDSILELSDEVMKDRAKEGKNLYKDILEHLDNCEESIKSIRSLHKVLMNDKKKQLAEISQKAQANDLEAQNQLPSMYEMLNKLDVNEEITRFIGHLEVTRELLDDKQSEKGKRFDFLIQELLREINTISSKCSDYKISSLTIDVKVELEKIREQVQNVL